MKEFVLLLLLSLMLTDGYSQDVKYVGHRGASHLAPENTLESIELAWELGAPAAECDIMLTKDNKVIVFHDKKGKRLTGEKFKVSSVTYDEIDEYPIKLRETNLDQYRGATIPLLSEVLDILPEGKTLVIEIKTGTEILPFMQEVISEHHQSGKIAFIAFDYETINAAKEMYPDTPCYYLSMFKGDVNKKFDEIVAGDLDGVNLRHAIVDKELVNRFNNAGKDVWCWTVNDTETAQKMIDAGVSAITTDRPKWLEEQMYH